MARRRSKETERYKWTRNITRRNQQKMITMKAGATSAQMASNKCTRLTASKAKMPQVILQMRVRSQYLRNKVLLNQKYDLFATYIKKSRIMRSVEQYVRAPSSKWGAFLQVHR